MLVEGNFSTLVEEIADYIDNIRTAQDASSNVRTDITPALEALTKAEEAGDAEGAEKARDEALKVLVPKTDALNSAPEKGMLLRRRVLKTIAHHNPQNLLPRTTSSSTSSDSPRTSTTTSRPSAAIFPATSTHRRTTNSALRSPSSAPSSTSYPPTTPFDTLSSTPSLM